MKGIKRQIGCYTGQQKGPLLVCLAGVHGNEPAGVKALERLFEMLEREPRINPGFAFRGRLVGLRGNVKALDHGLRFIDRDLNRIWTDETMEHMRSSPASDWYSEEWEVHEILETIQDHIDEYQAEHLIVMDLHTTTAFGGIFTLATEDEESLRIAGELIAPIVLGLVEGVRGTTLHYFRDEHFALPTTTVVFESGQHGEPLSVTRAVSAIINCLRTIGCLREEDVENRHDALLIQHSMGLPRLTEMLYCHKIREGDGFRMVPGKRNFQRVRKGEHLASDKHGPIFAEEDGLLLMPLYQVQGEDGFFIIREINSELP